MCWYSISLSTSYLIILKVDNSFGRKNSRYQPELNSVTLLDFGIAVRMNDVYQIRDEDITYYAPDEKDIYQIDDKRKTLQKSFDYRYHSKLETVNLQIVWNFACKNFVPWRERGQLQSL